MKKLLYVVVSCILLFTLSACNSSKKEGEERAQDSENMKMEYNIKTKEWSPLMMQYGKEHTLEAYAFAAEHSEVLDYMPCYCGCYETDGHTNNTACFIDSIDGDIATLDSMGLG
ncbi:MAG TPA: hypothetical protein GX497_12135 [Bacillus bacterium]|nr:hypothetical protein [Bacillus sp. (in: firmicutes)]